MKVLTLMRVAAALDCSVVDMLPGLANRGLQRVDRADGVRGRRGEAARSAEAELSEVMLWHGGRRHSARRKAACVMLRGLLGEGARPLTREVRWAAEDSGVSQNALKAARVHCGVEVRYRPGTQSDYEWVGPEKWPEEVEGWYQAEVDRLAALEADAALPE